MATLLKLGERLTGGLAVALLVLALMAGGARADDETGEQSIRIGCNLNSAACLAAALITPPCLGNACPVPFIPCGCNTSWLTGACVCL